MTVKIVSGTKFEGLNFGTASGSGSGYVVGSTPACDLLLVGGDKSPTAQLFGLKYFHHSAGHKSEGDRPADAFYRMTMLVSDGCWRQKLWKPGGHDLVEVILNQPGDFIAWAPGVLHSWQADVASTMLTLSFKK